MAAVVHMRARVFFLHHKESGLICVRGLSAVFSTEIVFATESFMSTSTQSYDFGVFFPIGPSIFFDGSPFEIGYELVFIH